MILEAVFLYKPTLPPEILKLEGISTISRLKVVNFQKHREKSDWKLCCIKILFDWKNGLGINLQAFRVYCPCNLVVRVHR